MSAGSETGQSTRQASMAFGDRLRHWRRQKGMKQVQLHEASGVGHTHLSRLERGLGNPTIDLIVTLSCTLGCSPFDLLGLESARLQFVVEKFAAYEKALKVPLPPSEPGRPKSLNLDEMASPMVQFIGSRLKAHRTARCLLLADVSELTGISASYLALIERGRGNLTLAKLMQLTLGLGMELPELLCSD